MDKKIIIGILALIVLILAAYFIGEGILYKSKPNNSATGNVYFYVIPKVTQSQNANKNLPDNTTSS